MYYLLSIYRRKMIFSTFSSTLRFVSFNLNKFQVIQRNIHSTLINNAGHSKWANIRHIKAAKDGQKAAMFTKLSRQIRLAIQGKVIRSKTF